MQFLENSMIELNVQTSSNLPPDVREAMGMMLAWLGKPTRVPLT